MAFGNFPAGLVELGLHIVIEFKLVFQKIINPCADFLDFAARQPGNGSFNFLNCAHAGKISQSSPFEKWLF
jgi:hypothetical protein